MTALLRDRLPDCVQEWFLGPFYDKGHEFDDPVQFCVNCRRPAIDLFEDRIYGDIPDCATTED